MTIRPGRFVKVLQAHCTPGLSPDTALMVTACYGSLIKVEYPAPPIKEDHPDKIGQERPSKNLPLERLVNKRGVVVCEK